MDTQLTLFDQPTAPQINTVPPTSCKIIQFPGTSAVEPPKKVNYRKGEEQTVFPIKSREQLDAMACWHSSWVSTSASEPTSFWN